jgi:CBS domain-containing protein
MAAEATSTHPSHAGTHYTSSVTDLTEGAVARRVPAMTDERLGVLSRRQPVTVPPGTSLADCVRAIQKTGTGDSVFVCEPDGTLVGVLTERDIFARIVVGHVDLAQPVESLMTTEPRNVPIVDDRRRLVGVVRQVDIIKYLAESFPEELLNLPPRPHQRMGQAEGG